jgi:hypothetical protein
MSCHIVFETNHPCIVDASPIEIIPDTPGGAPICYNKRSNECFGVLVEILWIFFERL